MERYNTFMQRAGSTTCPRDIVVVDTETEYEWEDSVQAHTLRIGHAKWLRWPSSTDPGPPRVVADLTFHDTDQFWEWLDGGVVTGRTVWVYAHNLGFDLQILAFDHHALQKGWKVDMLVDAQPPCYVSVNTGHGRLKLCDSMNIWPTSLEDIGESLGRPKLAMPEWDDCDSEWAAYCSNDVDILVEALSRWRSMVLNADLGKWTWTIGGQAMNAWRRRIRPNTLLTTTDDLALKMARAAYHGGRCEAFMSGRLEEPLVKLDINSQYPAVMRDEPMPVRLAGKGDQMTVGEMEGMIQRYCFTARCLVDMRQPVFPVRTQIGTVYPTGQFWTMLTTPEIMFALERGWLREVGLWAAYVSGLPFTGFVDDVWDIRQQAEIDGIAHEGRCAKLLHNSLAGKLGQRGRRWEVVDDAFVPPGVSEWLEADEHTGEVHQYRWRMGHVQRLEIEGETYTSMPAIAAHITAAGRIKLWDLIDGLKLRHVHYCDTDGVIARKSALQHVEHLMGSGMGQLRLDGEAESFICWGRKDYLFGGERKLSGVSRRAEHHDDGSWTAEFFHPWRADHHATPGTVIVQRVRGRRKPARQLHPVNVQFGGQLERIVLTETDDIWLENELGKVAMTNTPDYTVLVEKND